ncbi:di-trans,poly-cis-decaprenylcistransferase [Candidatus Gottesmanbacteria bacterium]|nr:di-trans,poly-cis-decaprenylcistransferase [Candidatus Gottesmanbacteria bacterium]
MNHKPLTIPTHIAVIMDGNRRWAREHNLPILEGHRRVANEILEPLIEYAAKRGIKYLTFWAWSTENWQRDKKEVEGIMRIFRNVISRRWQKLHEKEVRIRVIGDISKFSPDIREALEKVVAQTKDNKKITAVFALNYGGRDEILRAMNKADSSELSADSFARFLDTKDVPDPDMIVRTGGEERLSGFLPWQSVYSELYFPSWFMPEFTQKKFDEVLEVYAIRSRRFGR